MSSNGRADGDSGKRRLIALLLAALPGTGALGLHKFYLGHSLKGGGFALISLVTFPVGTLAMQLLAWGTAVHYVGMGSRGFHDRVIASRGGDEASVTTDDPIVDSAPGYFAVGRLRDSLRGAHTGTVFLTETDLVLGHRRTVKGGTTARTIRTVLYGGAVRGFGRAVPGLGLVLALLGILSRTLFRSVRAPLTLARARESDDSIIVPLADIESVAIEERGGDSHYVRITIADGTEDVWLVLGKAADQLGDADATQAFREQLETQVARATSAADSTEIHCPHCGHANPADATKCQHCQEELPPRSATHTHR